MKRRVALLMVLMLLIPVVFSPSLALAGNDAGIDAIGAVPQSCAQPMEFWWVILVIIIHIVIESTLLAKPAY